MIKIKPIQKNQLISYSSTFLLPICILNYQNGLKLDSIKDRVNLVLNLSFFIIIFLLPLLILERNNKHKNDEKSYKKIKNL